MRKFLIAYALALAVLCQPLVAGDFRFIPWTTAVAGGIPTPDFVWWKMSEGTGTTTADNSTAGLASATLSTASLWSSPGASGAGSSLLGNGAGGAATFHFNSTSTVAFGSQTTLTLSYWIYVANYTSNTQMNLETNTAYFNGNGCLVTYTDTTTVLGFGMSGPSGASTLYQGTVPGPSINTWHNVFVVYKNLATPLINVWVDGVSQTFTVGTNTYAGSGTAFTTQTIYGLARGAGVTNFSGCKIDDVRIWAGDQSAYVAAVFANPQ